MTTKVIPRLVTNNILIQNEAKREDQVWHISVEPKNNHRLSIGTGEDLRENRKLSLELSGSYPSLIIGSENAPEVNPLFANYGTSLIMPFETIDSGFGSSRIQMLGPNSSTNDASISLSIPAGQPDTESSFRIQTNAKNCLYEHLGSEKLEIFSNSGQIDVTSGVGGSGVISLYGDVEITGSIATNSATAEAYHAYYSADSNDSGFLTLFDTSTYGGTITTRVDPGTITYDNTTGQFTLPTAGLYKLDCTAFLRATSNIFVTMGVFKDNNDGVFSEVYPGYETFIDTSVGPVEKTISVILDITTPGSKFYVYANPDVGADARALPGTSISIHKLVA